MSLFDNIKGLIGTQQKRDVSLDPDKFAVFCYSDDLTVAPVRVLVTLAPDPDKPPLCAELRKLTIRVARRRGILSYDTDADRFRLYSKIDELADNDTAEKYRGGSLWLMNVDLLHQAARGEIEHEEPDLEAALGVKKVKGTFGGWDTVGAVCSAILLAVIVTTSGMMVDLLENFGKYLNDGSISVQGDKWLGTRGEGLVGLNSIIIGAVPFYALVFFIGVWKKRFEIPPSWISMQHFYWLYMILTMWWGWMAACVSLALLQGGATVRGVEFEPGSAVLQPNAQENFKIRGEFGLAVQGLNCNAVTMSGLAVLLMYGLYSWNSNSGYLNRRARFFLGFPWRDIMIKEERPPPDPEKERKRQERAAKQLKAQRKREREELKRKKMEADPEYDPAFDSEVESTDEEEENDNGNGNNEAAAGSEAQKPAETAANQAAVAGEMAAAKTNS